MDESGTESAGTGTAGWSEAAAAAAAAELALVGEAADSEPSFPAIHAFRCNLKEGESLVCPYETSSSFQQYRFGNSIYFLFINITICYKNGWAFTKNKYL